MGLVGRSKNAPHYGMGVYSTIENKQYFDGTMLHFLFDVGENPSPEILGTVALIAQRPFFDDKVNLVENSVEVNNMWAELGDGCSVKGIIYKVRTQKLSFPKDIKPNEPIKTDKRTRMEVNLPNVGKVNIAENTTAVFKSENLLEIAKGKIHSLIKKLKPKTKFEIHTPTCVTSGRGTEYLLDVADDGTTTLIVLDGEVEISDLENKKTVIVKKNQKSIVKPGKLPSEPVNINPEQILKWWE